MTLTDAQIRAALDHLGEAEGLDDSTKIPVPHLHRPAVTSTGNPGPRRRWLAAAAAVLIVGGGVVAPSVARIQRGERLVTEAASPLVEDVIEAPPPNELPDSVGVVDANGVQRGFISISDLDERDDRVLARIMDSRFREPVSPVDKEYNTLSTALCTVDPVPVVDTEGNITGYFNGHFITIDEQEAAVPSAEATIDRFLN